MARKANLLPTAVASDSNRIQCAHETCHVPASVRVKTGHGWANLCLPHYERHFDKAADARFAELGLERGLDEDRKAWRGRIMVWVKSHAKLKTFADAAEDEWSQEA